MWGIVDSGVGGLSVLRRLRAHGPEADILYLADQANAPLGVRSTQLLAGLFQRYVDRLETLGARVVAMGSNTLCAAAHEHGWPTSPLTIVDLIAAGVSVVETARVQQVGVLATAATARAQMFTAAIGRAMPHVMVDEVGASELVDVVESGDLRGADGPVAAACARFRRPPDAILLGCTHFPFLESALRRAVGPAVTLLDPADAVAHATRAQQGPLTGRGTVRYLTTGDPAAFRTRIERLMGPLGERDSVEHTPTFGIHDAASAETGDDASAMASPR